MITPSVRCVTTCLCPARYVMGGRTFECLEAVINRYKVEQIVEGHTLSQPVKVGGRVGLWVLCGG